MVPDPFIAAAPVGLGGAIGTFSVWHPFYQTSEISNRRLLRNGGVRIMTRRALGGYLPGGECHAANSMSAESNCRTTPW